MTGIFLQLPAAPGLGQLPVAVDHAWGLILDCGNLAEAESCEEMISIPAPCITTRKKI